MALHNLRRQCDELATAATEGARRGRGPSYLALLLPRYQLLRAELPRLHPMVVAECDDTADAEYGTLLDLYRKLKGQVHALEAASSMTSSGAVVGAGAAAAASGPAVR